MYISTGMLNRIQEQVPLMSQLTAQLHSQSLCHYTISQLQNNAAALTSSLHHHHFIRRCQTSLSMLLRLMPLCRMNTCISRNCYLLLFWGNPHRTSGSLTSPYRLLALFFRLPDPIIIYWMYSSGFLTSSCQLLALLFRLPDPLTNYWICSSGFPDPIIIYWICSLGTF